jgi:hypothetical protein
MEQRNEQITKFAILSCGSHTSRNGLDADAEQSGSVHSIATYPYPISTETQSILQIGYSADELVNKDQSLLRIFMWDATSLIWKKIGGIVDSVRHYIRVPVTVTGTFAVFTSNEPDDVDEGSLYYNLQLTPNPCDVQTTLSLMLLKDYIVTVSLFDLYGTELAILSDRTPLAPGNHKLEINTSALPGGTYFIRVRTSTNIQIVKFNVVK